MENVDKRLTLILVLKDRSNFAERWFKFYNQHRLPYKVIVADSGKRESVAKNPLLYPNIDYQYVRYLYDESWLAFFKKVSGALALVKTPYVVFQTSDDDFYFVDALKDAINFLDAHSDYIAARGDMYNFVVKSLKNQPEEFRDIYGELKDFYQLFTNPSNTASSALERFKVFSRYSNTLWLDVCRTEEAIKVFKILCELEIQDIRFAEYFSNALIVASGKVYRGSGLYVLHQGHTNSMALPITKQDPFEWVESELWAPQFLKLLNALAKKIASIDGIPEQEAYNKTLQYYLANTLGRNVMDRQIEKARQKSPTITKLSHFLSKDNFLRKKIKKLYLKTKMRKNEIDNKRYVKSSPYYEKVEMIKDFLLHPPR